MRKQGSNYGYEISSAGDISIFLFLRKSLYTVVLYITFKFVIIIIDNL